MSSWGNGACRTLSVLSVKLHTTAPGPWQSSSQQGMWLSTKKHSHRLRWMCHPALQAPFTTPFPHPLQEAPEAALARIHPSLPPLNTPCFTLATNRWLLVSP